MMMTTIPAAAKGASLPHPSLPLFLFTLLLHFFPFHSRWIFNSSQVRSSQVYT